MRDPGFVQRLHDFLEHEMIKIDQYSNLTLICWNRDLEYMTREDAFKLYERNWRLVDEAHMTTEERSFLRELINEFGRGVINA